MRKILFIITIAIITASCTREPEQHTVRYEADKAITEISISYSDENGLLHEIMQNFNSGEDVWSYEAIFFEGDIVYLSGAYDDAGGSQRLRILVDGKTWRQGENERLPGEEGRITLSGVVPIE